MNKIIQTQEAPAAIGPYSQAVGVGGLVFCSGQIPLDKTGKPVGGGIAAQTRQVLKNILAVLAAANLSMNNVVKTTVYLTDLSLFAEMNSVYAAFFPENPPARSTVEVTGLPMGVLIEIEAIAAEPPPSQMEKQ